MRSEPTKFNRALLTVSAAGVLLASQAFAQDQAQANQEQLSNSGTATQQQNPEFRTMDQDQDQLLVWREIHVVMDPRILAAGLDQEQIFQQYDKNQDNALDEREFDRFVSGLQQAEGSAGQTAMGGSQQQNAPGQSASARSTQQSVASGESAAMNRDLTPTMGGTPGEAAAATEENIEGSADTGFADSINETDESLSVNETEYDTQADTKISDAEPIATFEEPNDTAVGGAAADANADTSLGSASGDNTQRNVPDDATQVEAGSSRAMTTADFESVDEIDTDDAMAADTDVTMGAAGAAAASGVGSAADVNAASEPTGQPQPTASTDANIEAQSIYQLPIESLKDKAVVNSAGEKIGAVEQVVVNNQSGEAGLVVSSGGVMGIGGSKLLAPVSEVTISGDNITWQTSKNKKELKNTEKFDSQSYQQVSDSYETLGEIGSEGLSAR